MLENTKDRGHDGDQLGFAGGDVLICTPGYDIRKEGVDDDDDMGIDRHIHHWLYWRHMVDAFDLRTEEENYSYSHHRDTEPGHIHLAGEPLDPAVCGIARAKPRSL